MGKQLSPKKLRIGISLFWGDSYNHIWSNGAGQNMYFLAQVLKAIATVEDVYFVYWGGVQHKDNVPKGLDIDSMGIELYEYTEIFDTTDIMIEGTLVINQEITTAFRNKGCKIISFRMGTDYLMDMEKFVYKLSGGRSFNGVQYDAVWMSPHLFNSNRDYVGIMTRSPVSVAPFLWSPFFLNKQIETYTNNDTYPGFGYKPGKRAKRITTLEPNISICKSAFTPILIIEETYRRDKSLIEHAYICNSFEKREDQVFKNFIGWTDILKDKILSVETRHITPYFLGRYTDIVVSHNWELGLNYVYLEALYGNYPLIHNSEFLKEGGVGFYYEGFNAREGASQLIHAIETYDKHLDFHKEKHQQYLAQFDPLHYRNIAEYKLLIEDVMNH